ncbi:MAG: alcohol dehydrogenase, partial [Actinomycetota bacterium]|nr:alcohol dehydrogenase [Actinomycetota bacterium]
DCSGSAAGQAAAVAGTRRHGRCVLVGEGGQLSLDVSRDVIHRQLTLIGSWVSSTWRMAELLGLLVGWELHPEQVVTDRFGLDQADQAYQRADEGSGGKVGIVTDTSPPQATTPVGVGSTP